MGPITEGLTGPAVSDTRINQAREQILARYRADGYVFTTVTSTPDQQGNLRFNVVEGYIADVKLQGYNGPAGNQVLRFLRHLLEERPIRIATLERYLLLATDIPGMVVRSTLSRAADDAGAITLTANLERKAVDGLLASDNRAFRLTGPEQLLAVASFNSFTSFGERTEVSILHSYNNTQLFGQAATEFFVGGSGLKVRLYGGAGRTEPSDPLRTLGYDGQTRVFGVQGSYPIVRQRERTLSAVLALDAIESEIKTTGVSGSQRSSFDSLRVVRTGLDYTMFDLLLGGDRQGVTSIGFRVSKGITALGATTSGDPQAGRSSSRTDFLKANAEISREQAIFKPTPDSSVVLYGLVAGQVSNSVLPPAEKFFLGGLRYNRGFYAGEVTGDNAVTATIELQYNMTVPVNVFGLQGSIEPQFYIFHDWGETWENISTEENRRLRSYGLGVRAQVTRYFRAEIEGVSRVTRRPQGATGQVSALKGDALYWRVIGRF